MKKSTLESFKEFSTAELDQLDKLNVLEEEKIVGGKSYKGAPPSEFATRYPDGTMDKRYTGIYTDGAQVSTTVTK